MDKGQETRVKCTKAKTHSWSPTSDLRPPTSDPSPSPPSSNDAPDTAVSRLSDTFILPGQSESTSKHTKKLAYYHSIAQIGIQVAGGLQHAHDQGILHRDIKPSNLLLDTRGTVWITDFGLAKTEGAENLTGTGDIIGTLRYMAPEAFAGKTDNRSDVYALGLTLYELLSLQPAFNATGRPALIKQVTHETPAHLRTIDPHIPRDLQTIIHKTIDRDPSHRYQSAQELTDDLQRYFDDEPIQARRISSVARFSRWCKRNPALAAATNAVVLLLVMITLVSVFAYQQTAAALTQAEDSKKKAVTKAETAKQVTDLLVRLFEGPKEVTWLGFQLDAVRPGSSDMSARELLDRGAQRTLEELNDQPDVQIALMDTLGHIYASLGDLDKAKPLLEEALKRRRKKLGSDHLDIAASLEHLALLRFSQGELSEAIRLHQESLAMRRKLLGSENLLVADSLFNLGFILTQHDSDRYTEAEGYFQESLNIREKLLDANHRDVAHSLWGVAWAKSWQLKGVSPRELKWKLLLISSMNARATKIFAAIDGGKNLGTVACLFLDSSIKEARGQKEAAARGSQEIVALAEQVLGKEHPLVAVLLLAQVRVLQATGKKEKAEEICRRVLAIRRKIHGDDHALVADAKSKLANALNRPEASRKQHEEAETLFRNALAFWKKTWEEGGGKSEHDKLQVIHALNMTHGALGNLLLRRLGRPKDAEKHCLRAVELRQKAISEYNSTYIMGPFHSYRMLGSARNAYGNLEGALDAYRKADEIVDSQIAAEPDNKSHRTWKHNHIGVLLQALRSYADELEQQKKQDKAEKINREMQAYIEKLVLQATDDPDFCSILANQMTKIGMHAEAEVALSKAIELDPKDAELYSVRGDIKRNTGKFNEVTDDYARAVELDSNSAHRHSKLARNLIHKPNPGVGDHERALKHARKAVELDMKNAFLHASLGRICWMALHDGKEALQEIDKAIEIDPNLVYAYIQRESVNRGKGDLSEALNDIQKAIHLNPKSAYAIQHRGVVYKELGRFEEALADFNALEQLNPNGHFPYLGRASVYYATGQHQKALQDYNKAMERPPISWHHYKRRGVINFHLKNYDDALADITKSLELNPKDTSALVWISPSLVAKCPDESFKKGILALADNAVEKSPNPAQARRARISLYLGLNEFDKARDDFNAFLTPDNKHYYDHYQHALLCLLSDEPGKYRESCQTMLRVLADTKEPMAIQFAAWTCALVPDAVKNYDQPIALATKAVEAEPKSDEFQNALGAILYRAGRHEEALGKLTDLAERLDKPDNTSQSSPAYTWYFLAMAQHKTGNNDEAAKWLTKANDWTDKVLADEDSPPTWNRRLTLQLFRNEAEGLLNTVQTPDNQENPKPTTESKKPQ